MSPGQVGTEAHLHDLAVVHRATVQIPASKDLPREWDLGAARAGATVHPTRPGNHAPLPALLLWLVAFGGWVLLSGGAFS